MKVLFLVGPHASGKTYSTKLALQKEELKGIKMIDTGPIIREIHEKVSPNTNIKEWVQKLEEEYGEEITDDIVAEEIKRRTEDCKKVIIIGYRTKEGIDYLIKKNRIEDYQVTYIDAPLSLLYENYKARTKKHINKDKFRKYIEEELADGLLRLRDYSLQDDPKYQYFFKESNERSIEPLLLEYFKDPKIYQKN